MPGRSKGGFRIDPPKRRNSRFHTDHPMLLTLFVLIFAGVLWACVWFLGFSRYGFAWSGNTAVESDDVPDEVVTSYPRVEITLDDVALLLDIGETATIKPHFRKLVTEDIRYGDLYVRWRSENPSVATVDDSGHITGVQPGTARIFVTIANSDIDSNTAHCLVTVRKWKESNPDTKNKRWRRR